MAKTRAEIFDESGRRYPDFGDSKQHGLSLGFEEGAGWASSLEGAVSVEEAEAKALTLFPSSDDRIEETVAAWRRSGFKAGVAWVTE